MFEPLMASEEGGGEKASDMRQLADVYPNVQGLVSQHWHDPKIRARFGSLCHESIPQQRKTLRRMGS